ncbi:alpha/beta fold hydrolase [Alkalicoccus daliensis]|uniref:Cephalosporin-C deacetylase n=1 Tax=Alkalicoccus daliensis TaxID=745820 RepID=A0A1H0JP97_9BACI|nr:alpha/beta fold hydrolase [Alkalicoccus daliensis]SDO45319.1 cephalosporin-C deacetylase [Alkalicoccus daliensis]
MPLIDLPLDKLYTYNGRMAKPNDFDAYWDRALQELQDTHSEVEISKSSFQTSFADCYDLYFTGVKGARIYAKYVQPHHPPEGKDTFPAVLEFHGYSMNSGDWTSKLAYAAAGYAVFSMDVRGQGGKSEDPGGVQGNTLEGHIIRGAAEGEDSLFFRNVYLDTVQLARIVMKMKEIDETDVSVTGWSQGGGLTLACAALEPRVKKAAAVYPFLSDYLRVWEMDLAVDAYKEMRTHFRRHDPTHERKEEFFARLNYIDIRHLMPRIKGEIMMGTGLMDTVCPPSTQFAAYNNITSKKEVVIYPDFAHENLPGMHDRIWSFLTK